MRSNTPETSVSLVPKLTSTLMALGALLPWENFHPDAEAVFIEDFRFKPTQWLWRSGVLVVAGLAIWVARAANHSDSHQRNRWTAAIGGLACLWMLGATALIGFSYYDFEAPTPVWFTESTVPWIGFYVAWFGAAATLIGGVLLMLTHKSPDDSELRRRTGA